MTFLAQLSIVGSLQKIGQFTALLGTYHQEQNHWTLVYIDLVKRGLFYIDPLALLCSFSRARGICLPFDGMGPAAQPVLAECSSANTPDTNYHESCSADMGEIAAYLLCVYVTSSIIFCCQMKHIYRQD